MLAALHQCPLLLHTRLSALLQEQYGLAAMASLINLQAGAAAEQYGAAVLASVNRTDLNSLQDVVGRRVRSPD